MPNKKHTFLLLAVYFILVSADSAFSSLRIPLKLEPIPSPRLLAEQNSSLNTIPLVGYEGLQYVATLELGPDKDKFNVLLDTGSSWLWIPDANLSSQGFENKTKYNCSLSTTCKANNRTEKIPIESGNGVARVFRANEKVAFRQNLIVPNMMIGLATSVENLEGLNADGVLGLGFAVGRYKSPSFLDALYSADLIRNRMFSLYLCHEPGSSQDRESQLIIDGYDSAKTNNTKFTYIKTADPRNWTLTVGGLLFLDTQVVLYHTPIALIAVQRGHLGLPASVINQLITKLRNSNISCIYDQLNFPKCQCSDVTESFPPLTFSFTDGNYGNNSLNLTIYGDSYVSQSGGSCEIQINTIAKESHVWILGNNFLRNYYLMFNMDNSSIGFATNLAFHRNKFTTVSILYVGIVILVAGLMLMFWVTVAKSLCKKKRGSTDDETYRPMASIKSSPMGFKAAVN